MSQQARQKPSKKKKTAPEVRPKRRLTAEDEDDIRAGLAVLNDPDEDFIPLEEIAKKYGLTK